MQDHHVFPGNRRPVRDGSRKDPVEPGVIDFAAWVMALLAARKSTAEPVLRSDLLAAFHAAAIEETPEAMQAFLRDLVRQKIPAETVADLYIPALARQLGDDWLDDRVSFMEVTLASSRMQAMLRAMGAAWMADLAGPGQFAALLLVVLPHEQHTLGAMVLLGQLRRMGISVRLSVAPEKAELRVLLATGRYQGVLVSAASAIRLADLRGLVEEVRRIGPDGMVVAVGGHILQSGLDVKAATGADLATGDLGLVLDACGIRFEGTGARQRA
jgi:MerR family transcriptional regulator, light-induced transcriptional regulator